MKRWKIIDILVTVAILCLYAVFFVMFYFQLDFSKPVLILLVWVFTVLKITSDLNSNMSHRMKTVSVAIMAGVAVFVTFFELFTT